MITDVSRETRVATESGIELLEEMVSIPSFSTQERELGQWLVARLRGMGFAASRDEAGNVVAFWGSGPREVMLLGHMDTVAGFIPVRREGNRRKPLFPRDLCRKRYAYRDANQDCAVRISSSAAD